MDVDAVVQVINEVLKDVQTFFRVESTDSGISNYKKLSKLFHVLAPLLTAVILYHYFKYLLIFNAYQYEIFVKNRSGYLKKLSRQLRHLSKLYGNFYFCYMPMNHGTTLPPTHSLFMAIKEVLINSNRPATRNIRTNLLLDLLHGDHHDNVDVEYMRESDLFDVAPDELDPLFEYNLDIMKCSRELIIQGIKDFDVMTTVYRVMETVMDEAEYMD